MKTLFFWNYYKAYLPTNFDVSILFFFSRIDRDLFQIKRTENIKVDVTLCAPKISLFAYANMETTWLRIIGFWGKIEFSDAKLLFTDTKRPVVLTLPCCRVHSNSYQQSLDNMFLIPVKSSLVKDFIPLIPKR